MSDSHRAAWMRDAKWGVFAHYLAQPASSKPGDPGYRPGVTIEAWNQQVDSFDVRSLAESLSAIHARYFFLTIGQNSGYYCAPNETYDRLVGRTPSWLSRRDLVADLAAELEPRGIRTLVYLPSHAPADDRQAVEALECTPDWDATRWQLRPGRYLRSKETDERLSAFQRNWEAIVTEWSSRWGRTVHGWWIDGCYHADRMYRYPDAPNFASFAAALRSGNPDSIVAFNPGVRLPVTPMSDVEDYTAGEVSGAFPITAAPWERADPQEGLIGGVQYHLLTYAGAYWGRGEPRLSAPFLRAYTEHIHRLGGVVTWDVPISADGTIGADYLELLRVIR